MKKYTLAQDQNRKINSLSLKDLALQAKELVEIDTYLIETATKHAQDGIMYAEENIIRGKQNIEDHLRKGERYSKAAVGAFEDREGHTDDLIALDALPIPFSCPIINVINLLEEKQKSKNQEVSKKM